VFVVIVVAIDPRAESQGRAVPHHIDYDNGNDNDNE
jgi:hypothetical protein